MIEIVQHPIDISMILSSVSNPAAGAIDLFIGTTRNNVNGKKVLRLEYEAYEQMAISTMQTLVEETKKRWSLCNVSMVHRIGRVDIGEASVVIAVSSAHRNEAFEACRYLIDTLKQHAPIWKKEYFEDGESWVNPLPN